MSCVDNARFHTDKSIKTVSIDEIPLAFTLLKHEAVPSVGGCCVTSVFQAVNIYDRLTQCETLCIGRTGRGVDSDLVNEVIAGAKPKGYKTWAASEWPVFRFIGFSGEPDSDGDYKCLAVRMVKLELNPSKYLTDQAASVYRLWRKSLYKCILPWQADQWAYNVMYRMQHAKSATACKELASGLPACMQETLVSCCSKIMSSKNDYKSLYDYIYAND